MIARTLALIVFTAAVDLTGKEGYFVKTDTDPTQVTTVSSATADVPLGVVSSEAVAGASAGILIGDAFAGTTRVKLSATPGSVVNGAYGVLTADGSVKLDPGTGARVRVCRFLESGAANERVEAVLISPVVYAS